MNSPSQPDWAEDIPDLNVGANHSIHEPCDGVDLEVEPAYHDAQLELHLVRHGHHGLCEAIKAESQWQYL